MTLDDRTEQEQLDLVFGHSLFEALCHRRVRRFGLGYELDDGTFAFKSTKEPVPLSDLETALVLWAGDGINGLALGEAQVATGVHSTWNGRVHPCSCNDQHTLMLFVDDRGVFAYEPPSASRVVEVSTPEDRRKILGIYRTNVAQLAGERPDFSSAAWIKANLWMANRPGSSMFFPLIDVSAEYINILLAIFEREKLRIIDERTGDWAGIGTWIKDGKLSGPQVTLSYVELTTLNSCIAAAHYKAQNMALACEAIGIGNATFNGFTPMVVLGGTPFSKGLGLRFVAGKDGTPNPVGLDGHLEGHCPPYFASMDEAVDDIVAIRYAERGILRPDFSGATPFKDWQGLVGKARRLSNEAIQATKDFCNYVYRTYGRFPALIDTIQAPVATQLHHLDLDFYAKYYPEEAIPEAHRNHMTNWHDDL